MHIKKMLLVICQNNHDDIGLYLFQGSFIEDGTIIGESAQSQQDNWSCVDGHLHVHTRTRASTYQMNTLISIVLFGVDNLGCVQNPYTTMEPILQLHCHHFPRLGLPSNPCFVTPPSRNL